jgi:hypothetical protein
MNARCRPRHARWWLQLAVASGVTIGALALQSVPAEAAPLAPNTVFAGLSSQQLPSFFEITNNGRMLKLGAIAFGMTCTSGDEFVWSDRDVKVPISRTGKLRANFAQAPTLVSSGVTVGGTDMLDATLNRRHTMLTGTWRLVQTYISSTGQTDQCDSGPVRFTDTD